MASMLQAVADHAVELAASDKHTPRESAVAPQADGIVRYAEIALLCAAGLEKDWASWAVPGVEYTRACGCDKFPTRDFSTAPALAAALCAKIAAVRVSDPRACWLLNRCARFPPLYEKQWWRSSVIAHARLLDRATRAKLTWAEGDCLLQFAGEAGVAIETHPAFRALRASRGPVYEYEFPAGSFADLCYFSNCVGDQLAAGLIAMSSLFVRDGGDSARVARARVDAYVAENVPDNRISQAFALVLAELETLLEERDARMDGAGEACRNAVKFGGSPPDTDTQIGGRTSGAERLLRVFSIAVAAELFENCYRRATFAVDAETTASICSSLTVAAFMN